MNINHLVISWSVSRGQDTYGYNICRLDDCNNGKRFHTCGGGYDMIGTVFADWLCDVYQERLIAYVESRGIELVDCGYSVAGYFKLHDVYGLTYNASKKSKVSIDGACGINSVERIAETIGLDIQWEGNKKGRTVGYFICEKGE